MWCDRPFWINGKALTAFKRQGIAETLVAIVEVGIGKERVEIALIPCHLTLTVEVEAIFTIPGGCAAKAVTVRADFAITTERASVSFAMHVMDCDPTNQLAIFCFHQQTVNTGLKLEDILVVIGV